ncbi:D-serine deaminase-like pyridoxal phosphate-dependent protein [Stackebrandtia endophytica]|uniref:D-serine deaminase-like pyridoxal phosphate-dependent protein n=1 Tax=Stackebrandtia endophytica TaxID=1496996 RepID=A0A543B2J8_9ACTN|nr:alanine racemase [Stackebrandtia endophytica]TQL79063.1 D-serine deaminase-like pyridoxal phosphate-dependent protein [Stackebrandtia endophytica]
MRHDTGLERCYEVRLDWRWKSIPPSADGLTVRQWLNTQPHRDDLATPAMTMDAAALQHNITAMADWCAAAGLAHMPHGKTTMAPQLWHRQLDAGAVGITLATGPQLRVARAFAVPKVLLANELTNPVMLRWVADWITDGGDVTCFVDSLAGVHAMSAALSSASAPLSVCVELGAPGARGGARDLTEAREIAEAIRDSPQLRLVGVGGYEGSLAHDDRPESIARVDAFLADLVTLFESLTWETDQPVITAGGSEYFDQVADRLAPVAASGALAVLRAGSYISHDDGLYAAMTPAARDRSGPQLLPALRARASVLSKPEPEFALLDVGRRDLSFDSGLPVLLDAPGATVVDLNDQHAHVRGDVAHLAVGDIVRLGVSHPCTTFDKWTMIPVLNDTGTIVDAIRTYF